MSNRTRLRPEGRRPNAGMGTRQLFRALKDVPVDDADRDQHDAPMPDEPTACPTCDRP